MRILVAAFAYNERPYIPYMVEYYRNQGCELLILDNYSTDGTYEWLLEHGVMTGRVDTKNTFYLVKLQSILLSELKRLKPDWVLYTGIDTYFYFKGTIREEVEGASVNGYTMISTSHVEAQNTGESFALPFQNNYFYVRMPARRRQMLARYNTNFFKFAADNIRIPQLRIFNSDGFLINYGMCKPKEEREITYQRRRKAWETKVTHRNHGAHYIVGHDRNWIWKKEELTDIRTTPYYNMMIK